MDLIENNKKTEKEGEGVYNWGVKYFGYIVSYPIILSKNLIDTAYDSLIEQAHPWKEERYRVGLREWINRIGKEKIMRWAAFEGDQEGSKEIRRAFAVLQDMDVYSNSPREIKQTFIKNIRVCLLTLSQGKHPEYLSIAKVCQKIFTEVHLISYLTLLVKFVSTCTHKEIKKEGSFLEYLQSVRESIASCPSKYLSPTLPINLSKLKKMTSYFDPLGSTNMPWLYETVKLLNKDVLHYRSGVPICPRIGPYNFELAYPYENSQVSVVPELLAYIDLLKSQNKKMGIFLHLDPTYLDRTGKLSGGTLDPFKQNEAIWASLIIGLEEVYPETVEVFLFPLDGAFLKKLMNASVGYSVKEIEELLLEGVIELQGSAFYLSRSIQQPLSMLHEVLKKVRGCFFSQFDDESILTLVERKVFYVLFCSCLKEFLVYERELDITQTNCTDGVDRTSVFILAQVLMHFNFLKKEIKREELAGMLFGPALSIWKRSVMRWDYMEALLNYFTEHWEDIKVPDQKVIQNASLPDRLYQPILPPLSFYKDKQEALRALSEEIETKSVVPKKIKIVNLLETVNGSFFAFEDLGGLKMGNKDVVLEGFENLEDQLLRAFVLKKEDPELQILKLLMTGDALKGGIEKLEERYIRKDDWYLCSKDLVCKTFIEIDQDGKGHFSLTFKKKFLLKDVSSNKEIAQIHFRQKMKVKKEEVFAWMDWEVVAAKNN